MRYRITRFQKVDTEQLGNALANAWQDEVEVNSSFLWGGEDDDTQVPLAGIEFKKLLDDSEHEGREILAKEVIKEGQLPRLQKGRATLVTAPEDMVWAGTYTPVRFAVVPDEDDPDGVRVYTELATVDSETERKLKIGNRIVDFFEAPADGALHGMLEVSRRDNAGQRMGRLAISFEFDEDDA